MISFKSFISEAKGSISADEAIAGIKKECQQFLKANRSALEDGVCIFRGVETRADALIGYPRSDRKSKDTNAVFSELIDSYFNHKFGFKYRSGGLFCSTSPGQARSYAPVFIVFPCGDYKILGSELVHDLYDLLTSNSLKYDKLLNDVGLDSYDVRELYRKIENDREVETSDIVEFDRIFDRLKYEETTKLQSISQHNFESGVELMLQCKSYYALKIDNQGGSVEAMHKYIERIFND